MRRPLISVIVPVYKVEDVLARCLDSLCRQSLQNIEILLIDDASPDRCGAICEAYAEKDPRFRVNHHPENRGLSAARNTGIENVLYFYYQRSDSIMGKKPTKQTIGEQFLVCWEQYCIGTIYKLVWKSARIYYLKRVLYYYYYRDGSITTLRSNPIKSDWRKMYLQRLADLSAWGYSAEKLEQYRLGCVMTYCIKFGWEEDRNDAHFIQWLRQCKEIPHCFTWKRKLLFVLLKFWPPLFNLVCTLWKKC